MLRPIPRQMLRCTLTLHVPTGFDRYQKPTVETYTVANVHNQADNTTRKTADNTEVSLKGILFVDQHYSTPKLDYEALQEQAQKAGGVMTCEITDKRGGVTGPYTILVVDALPDDEDNIHHYELGHV